MTGRFERSYSRLNYGSRPALYDLARDRPRSKIGKFLFANLEFNLSMLRRLYFLAPKIGYSFPVQLLLNNLKRNQVLLLCWIILFAMITGSFGKYLGIPYLFLDPEYL